MPQANSTTSSPRCTSPSASDSTLPCSAVMIAASSLAVALQQFPEAEHHPRAAQRRGRGPGRPRGGGGFHGAVDLGRAGQRDAAADLARGGVEHVGETSAVPGHGAAADEMPDLPHGRLLFVSMDRMELHLATLG